MSPSLRIPITLSAALGCTLTAPDKGESESTSGTPGDSTGEPTSTGSTTVEPGTTGTSTGETDTEPVGPQWCNGFDPVEPGFTVHNNADQPISDGTTLAAECGGQGTLMVAIYPHFGGFMPDSDSVSFEVVLDVEGFDLNPGGHFFSVKNHVHEIDCSNEEATYYGDYSYSFIPMFPPDSIPEINAIDGKPGHLHLTLHAPDGDLSFDADVIMAADIAECGY